MAIGKCRACSLTCRKRTRSAPVRQSRERKLKSSTPAESCNAACSAAHAALDKKARVGILEKASKGNRGGNSALTGHMRFVFHGIEDIRPLVGIESSHLSQQLAVLRRAGLVTTRKDGSLVVYAIRDPEMVALLASARRLLINSLSESQGLLEDLLGEQPT